MYMVWFKTPQSAIFIMYSRIDFHMFTVEFVKNVQSLEVKVARLNATYTCPELKDFCLCNLKTDNNVFK